MGGRTIRIPGDFDPGVLRKVLDVLVGHGLQNPAKPGPQLYLKARNCRARWPQASRLTA
jgi:hypothetical protein